MNFLKCLICNYTWRRNFQSFPRKCPRCQSKYWQTGKPDYQNQKWLFREFVVLGRTARQIGKDYDKKPETIYYWLKKFGIKSKERKRKRD